MGDQKNQRLDLVSQAAGACKQFLMALHNLQDLAERRPYLGTFDNADFTGSSLTYLDAGTVGVLFDDVVPSLLANYADVGNGGRNKQIIQQVAQNL